MKVLTAEQMRRIDQECITGGTPSQVLMENAGKAVAEETEKILGALNRQHVLVLVGPGNNGGDGLVAARHLHDWGAGVSVYICNQRPADDVNLELVRQRGITCMEATQDKNLTEFDRLLSSASGVIDALLGTGKLRPLQGIFQKVLNKVNAAKEKNKGLRIIAVDLPSGLDADNGAVDPACLYADNTVTLAFPKLGLFCFPGAERVGKLTVVDIGIPASLAEDISTELITWEWAGIVLPRRPLDANKGSFGRVLVVAGSINYIGAAYLACNGAMRVGAGLVTLATPASLQPVLAAKLTEVTYLPLPEAQTGIIAPHAAEIVGQQAMQYQVCLLGCGLGQSESAVEFVQKILAGEWPSSMILDADALNALAKIPDWWQQLPDDAILTPHPGEMSRLCGLSIDEVQQDRVGIARKLAREWHKTIVLKGAYTVIAAPDGRCRINPAANPGLASAGTGDVLVGAIAGLVAQGLSLSDAAALGVYLHSEAGDMVRKMIGDAGMIATDLLPALPLAIRDLKEKKAD
ncbi:NAD(P)H-hydrate dehydratase [Chloroflexota bacterium]